MIIRGYRVQYSKGFSGSIVHISTRRTGWLSWFFPWKRVWEAATRKCLEKAWPDDLREVYESVLRDYEEYREAWAEFRNRHH